MSLGKERPSNHQLDAGVEVYLHEPLSVRYSRPHECVLFIADSQSNPFFNLADALRIVAGKLPLHSVGKSSPLWFPTPTEVETVCSELTRNPMAVPQPLTVWRVLAPPATPGELPALGIDMLAYFNLGADWADAPMCSRWLNMRVVDNESRLLRGSYGADAAIFGILQDYMAHKIGCLVGNYHHVALNVSASAHRLRAMDAIGKQGSCPYQEGLVSPTQMFHKPAPAWWQDLQTFVDIGPALGRPLDPFFRHVASPMQTAWKMHIDGNVTGAISTLEVALLKTPYNDWLEAGVAYLRIRRNGAAS